MLATTSHGVRLIILGVVAVLAGWLPAGAATQEAFQRVGNMVQAHDGAQATLLTDGKVLVTGGILFQENDYTGMPLAGAELFDPKTNQFTAISPMAGPRDDGHRAVRLKDGRVLIMGGTNGKIGLRSAELFDPATRAFAAVSDMVAARTTPTTTLLNDGRVLVAGGLNNDVHDPTASAEVFDATAKKFQVTGSMMAPRYRHSAVALPDGRVVVLGGYGPPNGQVLRRVEIYDPKAGTFAAHGELVEARADMTATLLPDRRILLVGGAYTDSNGAIVGMRKSVEIYDPVSGQSTITDALTDARGFYAAASLADGRVLVTGGDSGSGVLGTAELVDPRTGKVSRTAPMTTGRASPTGLGVFRK